MTGIESFATEKLSETSKNSFNPDKLSDRNFDFKESSDGINLHELSDKKYDYNKDNKTFDSDKLSDNKFDYSKPKNVDAGETKTPEEKNETGESEIGKGEPIKNKQDGLRREKEVEEELKKKYPEEEGYEIIPEAYLRDKDGKIVKDPVTGEARRIDFIVVKDGKVVDSVEVTSKTADKTDQTAKEKRIRDNGGNFIKDSNGNLVEIPNNVQTRIERRD